MPRSTKKGPYIAHHLAVKVKKAAQGSDRRPIKTCSRASTVLPEMVNMNMAVHNGKQFVPIFITERMVGHKLGEFVLTRTFRGHANDKKTKQE